MNWRAVGEFWLLMVGFVAVVFAIVGGVYLWGWWFAAPLIAAVFIFASILVGGSVPRR